MHDLIVVSDLHLGRGLDPESGHYRRLETFFYDEDFRSFCRYLCDDAKERQAPFKLVLNGDVFDFLRVETDDAGPITTQRERRYGPTLTPRVAARIAGQILQGHPAFVEGLAQVIASGHEVILLPGNHDIEVQWEPVQDEVRRAVLGRVRELHGDEAAGRARLLLTFKSWFHYEPGRVWVEHGCQYDPENAFRYPLRRALAGREDEVFLAEQDFPLGNFFQRYLYNAFGNITFIVPSTRANARYAKWLLVNQPALLFRVLASHVPFLLQLLRRMSRVGAPKRSELKQAHEEELADLARSSGLGEKLLHIESLKYVGADVVRATSELVRQSLVFAASAVLIAIVGAALWALGSQAISELQVGLAPKAMLSVTLNFVILTALLMTVVLAIVRVPKAKALRPLRRAAREIASTLDVPIVTFGHTHDEVIARVSRSPGAGVKAWYFNTGTWIAVFTHDVLIPRERVQFTFLRVRGEQGELLHWSPGRHEPLRVVLLEDAGWDALSHPMETIAPGG